MNSCIFLSFYNKFEAKNKNEKLRMVRVLVRIVRELLANSILKCFLKLCDTGHWFSCSRAAREPDSQVTIWESPNTVFLDYQSVWSILSGQINIFHNSLFPMCELVGHQITSRLEICIGRRPYTVLRVFRFQVPSSQSPVPLCTASARLIKLHITKSE